MAEEIKKCLVCALGTSHRFSQCSSVECNCGCVYEIRGEKPLEFKDFPLWFKLISKKDAEKFKRQHAKKGLQ